MKVDIKKFNKLNSLQHLEIRQLRNNLFIRKQMINSNIITFDEHIKWVKYVKHQNNLEIFVIFDNNKKLLGTITISDIHKVNKSCYWSFFLKTNKILGLGPSIEFAVINYVFYKMKFKYLYCNVLNTNTSVVKLHKKFGFDIIGLKKKNNKKIFKEIFNLKISEKKWSQLKKDIFKQYENIFKKYQIKLS